jgi:hypothetical protein
MSKAQTTINIPSSSFLLLLECYAVSIITSYCHFRVTYASKFGVKQSELLNPENGSRLLDNENGGHTHSSTQPVDILLVSGNLSVSQRNRHTCVNDSNKR